jgi:hypothetical protein
VRRTNFIWASAHHFALDFLGFFAGASGRFDFGAT